MKHEKAVTFFTSGALAFLISFGGMACLVTAFDMSVNLGVVALCCAVSAVASSACYILPLSFLPVATMALAGGFLWRMGSLELSFQSLLFRLSRQYHNAYGWNIIRLNMYTSDDMETTLWLGICFIGMFIATVVALVVCKKEIGFPAIIVGILPLAACLVVTDTVPDLIFLYLLLFGLLLLLLTQTARRQDDAQGNKLLLIMALPLAVGLLALFLAVPPDTYAGQDRAQSIADAVLGSDAVQTMSHIVSGSAETPQFNNDKTDLTSVGVRLESEAEMMLVTADYSGTLYLRGNAMNVYDGRRWISRENLVDLYWPDTDVLQPLGEVEISTRYAHRMLYTPYYTRGVNMEAIPLGIENTKRLTEYSFAVAVTPDESVLRQNNMPLNYEEYIARTDAVDQWALPLLETIPGATTGTVYDRAQAIAAYVRSSAVYDTRTYRMPATRTDFARWFLEESETGYCVHFATATTVLLQASGIPARYVTGYMIPVEADTPTIVRLKHAHAWTEFFLPGFGWVVLESTPAILTQQETAPTQATEEIRETLPVQPQIPVQTQQAPWWVTVLWVVSGMVLIVAILWVQRTVRLRIYRRRHRGETPNEQALTAWQQVTKLSACLGETPDPALYELAQKAKYSQHTLQPSELQEFADYLHDARQKLGRKSLFHRFWYRVILALY